MTDVVVIEILERGSPGVGLPEGSADAGKLVAKDGTTPYLYKLVDPGAASLPQGLATTDSPTFAGGTYTGLLSVLSPATSSNTNVASTTAWVRGYVTSLGYGTGSVVGVTGVAPIVVTSSATTPQVSISAATSASAGSMSAADKGKLDSITVDTATTVLKRVKNTTGSNLAKGTPVYVVGSSGTEMVVAPADASVEATAAQTLGLVQADIASGDTGYVMAVGLLTGLNTASLTEGQLVWLSETTGQFTSTRPTQPAHGVVLGYCVKSAPGAAGSLYVKVDNGYELGELHDVLLSGSATGDVLSLYADGLWKGRTLGSAAFSASGAFATAAQGAKADTAVQPGNAALSDAREWTAETISQAEAEAGTATTRRAFTAQRLFQGIAAWWQGYSSSVGRALATAVDTATARSALGLGTAATTAASSYATAAQGALADTAVQPAGLSSYLTSASAASTYQPLDADLTSIAALSTTPFGRSLLTQADAAATRTAIGAGTSSLALSSGAPANLAATASAGTATDAARADHVHQQSTPAEIGALPSTFSPGTVTYAATTDLNMSTLAGSYQTLSLTGNLTLTTSNRAAGRAVTIRLISDASSRNLTFPTGWVFVGTKPTALAASKTAVLTVAFFGTADTDAVAAYAVQS